MGPSEIECQIIVTLLLAILDTWFWCLTPGFWVWGIIWDHFREPEGQEQGGGAVGCQGQLQGVKL